jgi:hypothetical protein
MGVYNPYAPRILGQEFAPIREEGTVFSPAVNVVELGHRFVLAQPRQVGNARFYINTLAPGDVGNQVYMASVYPAGLEDQTGPINSVIIPCNSGAITGTNIGFFGSPTIPAAVASPSDAFSVSATPSFNVNPKTLDLWFATAAYSQLLAGKRIVGVNFLYQLAWDPTNATNAPAATNVDYIVDQSLGLQTGSNPATVIDVLFCSRASSAASSLLTLNPPQGRLAAVTEIAKRELGDVNHLWQTPSTTQTSDKVPWRYDELLRFERTSGSNNYRVHIEFGATAVTDWAGIYYLGYAALEVLYCEEQRVAYGGAGFGNSTTAAIAGEYNYGANVLTLRDPSTLAATPVLPAGEYTVTVSSANIGDLDGPFTINDISRPASSNTYPTLNALRELYPLTSHQGVQVNVTQTVGETFTEEETTVLTQLTLHASGGPLTEVHVYGRQAVGQVYGTLTVTQEIQDGLAGGSASYPWVRFYARRFGDTKVPLSLTQTSSTTSNVSITPQQFDLLTEIIDGWKEVTLRFTTPVVMGTGTQPQFFWSATGELKGSRWEVLGAEAPALSGVPGNLLNLVPSPNQLSIATYGQPVSGASINMGWIPQYAPPVSATVDDQTSDAVILFSQDSPAISGFTVSQLNQPLTGIGLRCGLAPEFVPTALAYNQLTWSPDQTSIVSDTFTRSVSNGWGSATSGQLWTASGGAASDFNVNGTTGTVLLSSTGVYRLVRLASTFNVQNVDGYVEISSNTAATGLDHWGSLAVRDNAGDEWYAQINFDPTGVVKLIIASVTSSVHTVLGTVTFAHTYTLNTKVKLRLRASGSEFMARAWMGGDAEPADWMLRAATTANNVPGVILTRSISGAGTPLTTVISYDNLLVSSSSNGYTELQRMDTLTDWATIMKAYDQDVVSFNDYEARVGLLTSYRIRYVNFYGFVGPWSATVTTTMTAPGITATSITADSHVWIFTTNSVQSGNSNLAYCLAWSGEVSEDFNFPEASGQVFQTMYGRDFVTVFRPSERGGTNFSRTMLVQAAAISAETLEDFTSLRDMAWADVPYICLRDEDGNRWFANVSVPGGTVLRDRRLYMAPVTIVEVTDTPTPVNP